jgi:hypothetical protein
MTRTRPLSSCALAALLATSACAATRDASPSPSPSPALASSAATAEFTCTQLMGVAVTQRWYGAGFERGVDGARWQELARPHAYVPAWADPESKLWSEAPSSPCESNASNPDRVVLVAVHWDYQTAEEWQAGLTAVVRTLQAKYPALRRVELLSGLRGPGNADCGHPKRRMAPFVDEGIARVAAAEPELVRAGPRFEVPSCALFKDGPYLTDEGNALVARMVSDHYREGGKGAAGGEPATATTAPR